MVGRINPPKGNSDKIPLFLGTGANNKKTRTVQELIPKRGIGMVSDFVTFCMRAFPDSYITWHSENHRCMELEVSKDRVKGLEEQSKVYGRKSSKERGQMGAKYSDLP